MADLPVILGSSDARRSPSIRNRKLSQENTAASRGGAIHASCRSGVCSSGRNTIRGNRAENGDGGAISVQNGDLVLGEGMELVENVCTGGARPQDGNGGAIAVVSRQEATRYFACEEDSVLDLDGCLVRGNRADGHGGAIYLHKLPEFEHRVCRIVNCEIERNAGKSGVQAVFGPRPRKQVALSVGGCAIQGNGAVGIRVRGDARGPASVIVEETAVHSHRTGVQLAWVDAWMNACDFGLHNVDLLTQWSGWRLSDSRMDGGGKGAIAVLAAPRPAGSHGGAMVVKGCVLQGHVDVEVSSTASGPPDPPIELDGCLPVPAARRRGWVTEVNPDPNLTVPGLARVAPMTGASGKLPNPLTPDCAAGRAPPREQPRVPPPSQEGGERTGAGTPSRVGGSPELASDARERLGPEAAEQIIELTGPGGAGGDGPFEVPWTPLEPAGVTVSCSGWPLLRVVALRPGAEPIDLSAWSVDVPVDLARVAVRTGRALPSGWALELRLPLGPERTYEIGVGGGHTTWPRPHGGAPPPEGVRVSAVDGETSRVLLVRITGRGAPVEVGVEGRTPPVPRAL